jgi:hypothetical protein
MMLGNMRELGVRHVIAYCHNEACRHSALIDVSSYPGDIEVPWFKRANRGKCGGKRVDVRPNWKEAPGHDRRLVGAAGLEQVMAPLFIDPCLPTISRTCRPGRFCSLANEVVKALRFAPEVWTFVILTQPGRKLC